ncbi:hypothetical protein QZH41_017470, partial [Actinostola sp. cb2023]
ILAQDDSHFKRLIKDGDSYIATSYVKYVEAAGARVVPIRNNLTEEAVASLFYSINGILLPGGSVDVFKSKYTKTAKILFKLAKEANDKGDVFPIWSTCLGYEMLHILVAKGKPIRVDCDAENLSLPLTFYKDFRKSRLLKSAPKNVLKYLSALNITMHMHSACITVKMYRKEKDLKRFFRIVATNRDRKNIEFVSMVEGINYPFYGSQFHPEKNQFEWTLKENINHSYQAIEAMQYLANFFVNQARMSGHKFASTKEERKSLIFNYQPQNCFENITRFDECYFF